MRLRERTSKAGWQASSSKPLGRSGLGRCASRFGRIISGGQSMATELYVVKHHGAWRIRVDGKHHGYMIYDRGAKASDQSLDPMPVPASYDRMPSSDLASL